MASICNSTHRLELLIFSSPCKKTGTTLKKSVTCGHRNTEEQKIAIVRGTWTGFERFTRFIYRAEKSRLNDCRSFLLEGEQSYDREPKSEDYQITGGWKRLQGNCQQAGHVSEYSKVVL